jgi:hypothetical protein
VPSDRPEVAAEHVERVEQLIQHRLVAIIAAVLVIVRR